jgi:hypothetical protein
LSVPEFWVCVKAEGKEFSEEAITKFISFAASFWMKRGFQQLSLHESNISYK